jgi:hypothetical protein
MYLACNAPHVEDCCSRAISCCFCSATCGPRADRLPERNFLTMNAQSRLKVKVKWGPASCLPPAQVSTSERSPRGGTGGFVVRRHAEQEGDRRGPDVDCVGAFIRAFPKSRRRAAYHQLIPVTAVRVVNRRPFLNRYSWGRPAIAARYCVLRLGKSLTKSLGRYRCEYFLV